MRKNFGTADNPVYLDLEEEHAVPLRPGDDPRAGMAQPHGPVAPWRHEAGGQGKLAELPNKDSNVRPFLVYLAGTLSMYIG